MKQMMNRASRFCYNRDLGLLLIRVATGLIFLVHGWEKFGNLAGTGMMMAHLGFGFDMGYFITALEIIGGVFLIAGIGTRIVGVLFGVEMTVAALAVGAGHGFNGYEFEMLLAAISFGLALAGSGRYSLYKMHCDQCGGMFCKGGPDCREKKSA